MPATREPIRPGVVIDGQTVYPPGWVFLTAIALKTLREEDFIKAKEAHDYWQSDFYEI